MPPGSMPCTVDPRILESWLTLQGLCGIRGEKKSRGDVLRDDGDVCNPPLRYACRSFAPSTALASVWSLALASSTSMLFAHCRSSGTSQHA